MSKRYAVILAAGQGTRMKSKLYKVLHPVAGRPMVQHVIDQLKKLNLDKMITVVGHGAEQVINHIGDESEFVIQEEQLGTGHAVQQAESLLQDEEGTTIVVYGDTPLITSETYEKLFKKHEKTNAHATVLTTVAPDPMGYGRIVRDENDEVKKIVEQKDASKRELLIDEINVGTYCFNNQALFEALKEVSNDNAQGEYYLTDVIGIFKGQGKSISAYQTPDFEETIGINDRVALAEAEKIMQKRINHQHMLNGVTIIDKDQTYIGPDVTIEQDVVIYPGSVISGKTTIEEKAVIGPHAEIKNSTVKKSAIVRQSTVLNSTVGEAADVGPYAYIRPDSSIGAHVRIGPYVEIKKAIIGDESKVSHLTYIGDAHVGKNVNVGCGTITVNYDGKEKHETKIGDHSFIGCNSNLVAPVTIGEGAYVAAGSTITKDVPEEALSIARARQTNKEGYASRLRKRKNN